MEKSDSISMLAKSLIKFQKTSKTIGFDKVNPYFKSKYATLTALVEGTRKELAECGLTVSQLLEGDGAVITVLLDQSGEFISSTVKIKPTKEDPQGIGSAITYTRRYAYAAILGLVSDEDDDANEASKTDKKRLESKVTLPMDSTGEEVVTVSFIPERIEQVQSKSSGNWRHDIYDPRGVKYMCMEPMMAAQAIDAQKEEKSITLEFKKEKWGLKVISLFLSAEV